MTYAGQLQAKRKSEKKQRTNNCLKHSYPSAVSKRCKETTFVVRHTVDRFGAEIKCFFFIVDQFLNERWLYLDTLEITKKTGSGFGHKNVNIRFQAIQNKNKNN